jgi:hypothetical protein
MAKLRTALGHIVSVKGYGAIGDGSTDDTTAVQDAIDAVNTAGGGVVYFPRGTYSVSALTLKAYVHLVGESRSEMEPSGTDKESVLLQRGTTGDVISTADYATLTYGAGIENLCILGNASGTAGRGVYFSQGTGWCVIKNCTIRRFANQGVVCGGVANTIYGNFIGANVQSGASTLTFHMGQLEVYGTDQFIERNEIQGPVVPVSYDGASLNNASLYAVSCLAQCASSWFVRNVFEIADRGLVLISRHTSKTGAGDRTDPYYPAACHSNTFIGNRADFNLGDGIVLLPTDSFNGPYLNSFVGNWVNACGRNANNTYDGIVETNAGANYAHSNLIEGNAVFNSAGATNEVRYGINTNGASALQSAALKTVVVGNRVDSGSVATAQYLGPINQPQEDTGTFTPELTFSTAGDLSVVYTIQIGRYTRVGKRVHGALAVTATTFTHATASGTFRITGLPYAAKNTSNFFQPFPCSMQGWTKASYTNTVAYTSPNATYLEVQATGSAQGRATLAVADVPTGSAKVLLISFDYETE